MKTYDFTVQINGAVLGSTVAALASLPWASIQTLLDVSDLPSLCGGMRSAGQHGCLWAFVCLCFSVESL